MKNQLQVTFPAIAENASLARLIVMGLVTPLDPDAQVLTEIKTVVSEAVTNAIVHGYEQNFDGVVELDAQVEDNVLTVTVKDHGVGIVDIEQAKQPLYTTKSEEERSGLGFMIIESFTDALDVTSVPGVGTTVTFTRKIT